LFRQWGGKYEPNAVPDGLDREVILEALEPTRIYVKHILRTADEINVKAAVHITGDAYLKFNKLTKFSKGIGFEFNNFKPQPIFTLIQETARQLRGTITDEEMFMTFNMGWGFAIIVEKTAAERTTELLNKIGGQAEQIGQIRSTEGIRILYKKRKINLR
jgi:phosphoribosylformylglycinamidine cyclo-ligase